MEQTSLVYALVLSLVSACGDRDVICPAADPAVSTRAAHVDSGLNSEAFACAAARVTNATGVGFTLVDTTAADISITVEECPRESWGWAMTRKGAPDKLMIAPKTLHECPQYLNKVLTHELLHLVGRSSQHSSDGVLATGVMDCDDPPRINENDLEIACAGGDCGWFRVER